MTGKINVTIALARFLVENKQINPDLMDDILQRQIIFGGSLDTNMLELGLLDEQTLSEALGHVHSLPLASRELLARRDPRMLNLFPSRLAKKHQVVPVAMGGRSVFVLTSTRIHPLVAEEISFMLSLAVKCHIVCEARLQGFLRSWFKIEIEPRYAVLLDRLGKFNLRTPGQTPGETPPKIPEEELKTDMLAVKVDKVRVEKVLSDIEKAERDESARREQARTGRISIEKATHACMQAAERDTIIDTTLRFTRQISPFVALFVVNNDSILGWDGVGADNATEQIKKIRLSVGTSSVLSTVIQTRAYYLGPIPESLGNNELLRALGRSRPPNVFVVPLTLKNRLIGLLYGDAGSRSIRGNRLVELLVFTSRLSAAFEQLILRRKTASKIVLKKTPDVSQPAGPRPGAMQFAEAAAVSSIAKPPLSKHTTPAPETEVKLPQDEAPVPGRVETSPSADTFPLPAPAPVIHAEEEPVVVDESFLDGASQAGAVIPAAGDDDAVVVVMDTETDFTPSLPGPVPVAPRALKEVQKEQAVSTLVAEDRPPIESSIDTSQISNEFSSVQLAEDAFSQSVTTQPEIPTADFIDKLCQDLIGEDLQIAQSACDALVAVGPDAVSAIMKHFPGRLLFDIRGAYDSVPPVKEHGFLLCSLVEIGTAAGSAVADRLEDPDPVIRYYAVRLLAEINCPEFVARLSERLYDRDALIRLTAVDTLLEYRKTTVFGRLLADLRSKLKDADPNQKAIAAALLGNFKDCDALPLLAPLVKASQKMVSRAACESLSYITKQDFGTSERKWIKWWKTHKGQRRVQWLIAGLSSKNRDIRFSSAQELNQITGEYFGYYYDSSKSDRERAVRQIEKWWEEKGRQLHFDD